MTAAYWAEQIEIHRGLPRLEPLKRDCGECAVLCGFYMDYALDLAAQPREVQEEGVGAWDCHLSRSRGCYGARLVLGQQRLRRSAHTRLSSLAEVVTAEVSARRPRLLNLLGTTVGVETAVDDAPSRRSGRGARRRR